MNEDILIEREEAICEFLKELSLNNDPRIDRLKKFSLGEIFFLVLCAQICVYETFREYEFYGKLKINLLRNFLPYEKGAPSRSTIARVLAIFNPEYLESFFIKWMKKIAEVERLQEQENVIAIDGKRHRGLLSENMHLVSAYDTKMGLVLGEERVSEKSNEITAIPILLDLLEIKGQIVSIDAMGCQKTIAYKICEKGANYVLALKANQGNLLEDVKDAFGCEKFLKNCPVTTRTDKGHGRIEIRTCYVTSDINWLDQKVDWKGLKSIAMLESKRIIKGKETIEKRYFITSLGPDPLKILCSTRAHWGIENSLHWMLDVIFGEDDRILWNKNIAQNEAIIRRIALNLLKKYRLIIPTKSERSEKIAIKTLRKNLIIDDEGMIKLLKTGF